MKKFIILVFLGLFIVSCWENETAEKPWMIKEAGQIMSGYIDTLEWSVKDARDVKKEIELNQDKLLQDIQKVR